MTYFTSVNANRATNEVKGWKRDPLGVFWEQFRSFFTLDGDNAFYLWPQDEMTQERSQILSDNNFFLTKQVFVKIKQSSNCFSDFNY
jgi:hypothetical protein